jgi:hypothetical protein
VLAVRENRPKIGKPGDGKHVKKLGFCLMVGSAVLNRRSATVECQSITSERFLCYGRGRGFGAGRPAWLT